MISLERCEENPILKPNKEQSWEAEAVFNGCPIKRGKYIYLLYRALSLPHYHVTAQTKMPISDIGVALSKDGIHFHDRRRLIVPEHSWERFGCEDPRVTKLGSKYYIFYTAISTYPFSADGIKVGVAITKDLKRISEKHLVTPFNAKAMALFPQKINGKMCAILTVNTDRPPSKIALAYFENEEMIWSEKFWKKWYESVDRYSLPLQRNQKDHVEIGSAPVQTKHGWLLFYSYIRNYFSPERLFTIEALLLDLKDPSQIIARTDFPLLVPEEQYERYGIVPNTIFPSGALIEGDSIFLYYGAADTTCCLAAAKVSSIIHLLSSHKNKAAELIRAKENPIISPIKEHVWESKATFNPAAIFEAKRFHLLYRAMSHDNTSVLGYASSLDGVHIDERSSQPIYVPREPFEQKLVAGGNSGCEDPRITKIGTTIYMTYTAFDGKHPPRIALTSIPLKKFLAHQWDWTKPLLISPPEFDNKDACLFPEKVNGRYLIFHRFGTDIDISFLPDLRFENTWLEEHRWLFPRKGMWDSEKIGIAAPPVKTEAGWLLLYHGVSEEDHQYRVGAVALSINDPTKILARTNYPILEPQAQYEKRGEVQDVVFPCGNVVIQDQLFVYYGAGDRVVGVATLKIQDLLNSLLGSR